MQDACGNALFNQVIQHTGGDHVPPVFINCPPDVIVESADDIPDPVVVTFTDCGNTYSINPYTAPATVFLEEAYGLLDEPGYCPDSIYRYYIAEDGCDNVSTCVQKIYISNDTVCELCQEDVQYTGRCI